jgi:O-antigen ligase
VFSSAIIIGVLSFLPSILNRFLSIIRGSQLLFARPVIYYSGFQIFLENPYGVGLGNHATAVQDYARSNEFDYPQWFIDLAQENTIDHMMWQFNNNIVGTHSDLFGFLVETGAIGVLFFILFWAIVLRHVIRSDPITSQIVLKVSILYVGFQSIINSQLLTGGGPVIVILLCLLIADERITGASNDLSNRTRHLSDNEN